MPDGGLLPPTVMRLNTGPTRYIQGMSGWRLFSVTFKAVQVIPLGHNKGFVVGLFDLLFRERKTMLSLALTLHLLAAIVWVGGMFFAHMALRPAVNQLLEPPQRLPLMLKVFDGFFSWVWGAVILILVSGYWLMFGVFQGDPPLSQWVMAVLGTLMGIIFVIIYSLPYRRMKAALAASELPRAAVAMGLIRRLIGVNLVLGLLVTLVAVTGKYSGF